MAHKKKTAKDSPGKQALAALHRISIKVSNEVYSPLLSQLTVSQFGILTTIYKKGPMNQKELAQHIQKTTGNLTTVIGKRQLKHIFFLFSRYVMIGLPAINKEYTHDETDQPARKTAAKPASLAGACKGTATKRPEPGRVLQAA